MKMESNRKHGILLAVKAALSVYILASTASAVDVVGPLVGFIVTLTDEITTIGNSIAVLMFIYGGVKYVYTANDPGGRKQAIGVCTAAVIALIIIQIANGVIGGIGAMIGSQFPAGVLTPP